MIKFTKEELIDFEKEVVEKFKEGNTYGPVHLSGGNEEQLLEIFKNIKDEDWVFSTHRSHYHALLKSGDRDWLMNEIIVNANSSHINSAKYKIFTSAIVGGIIPIALGVAMGIKRNWDNGMRNIDLSTMNIKKKIVGTCMGIPHVWCFVGDMAAEMGCFEECRKYAANFKLPITFIIENNYLGCNTPTYEVWGKTSPDIKDDMLKVSNWIYYNYIRKYPHYGIGEFVIFKKGNIKSKGDYQAYKNG